MFFTKRYTFAFRSSSCTERTSECCRSCSGLSSPIWRGSGGVARGGRKGSMVERGRGCDECEGLESVPGRDYRKNVKKNLSEEVI